MKRLLLILVFMLNSILLTENAESKEDWDYPVIVYIYGIKFNYQSGHSNDALDIRKNASTDIEVPEWWSINGRNENFAYIKSQNNRKIKASFCHNQRRHIYDLIIWADEYQNGFGDINDTEISFPGGTCGHYSYFEFTATGSVPGSIGKRSFYWKWYAEVADPPGPVVWVADTYHDYYTLLAAPQNPMPEPWTEVLDYSCDWASGNTSESIALREITKGAYNDFGDDHEYDGGDSHAVYPDFDLTGFLDDDWADCRDMSAVVHVFTRAIGGSSTKVKRIDGDWYLDNGYWYFGFKTKNILGIGNSTWKSHRWTFHQVGYKGNVYDATLKLNQSNPRIPLNEDVNGIYKNDLYDYGGGWYPQSSQSYQTVY